MNAKCIFQLFIIIATIVRWNGNRQDDGERVSKQCVINYFRFHIIFSIVFPRTNGTRGFLHFHYAISRCFLSFQSTRAARELKTRSTRSKGTEWKNQKHWNEKERERARHGKKRFPIEFSMRFARGVPLSTQHLCKITWKILTIGKIKTSQCEAA